MDKETIKRNASRVFECIVTLMTWLDDPETAGQIAGKLRDNAKKGLTPEEAKQFEQAYLECEGGD